MSNLQPGAIIAHANATNPVEHCLQCDAEIKGEPFAVTDYDDPLCSKDCVESHADNEAERAHERMIESFYSGEIPLTLAEQQEESRRLK